MHVFESMALSYDPVIHEPSDTLSRMTPRQGEEHQKARVIHNNLPHNWGSLCKTGWARVDGCVKARTSTFELGFWNAKVCFGSTKKIRAADCGSFNCCAASIAGRCTPQSLLLLPSVHFRFGGATIHRNLRVFSSCVCSVLWFHGSGNGLELL